MRGKPLGFVPAGGGILCVHRGDHSHVSVRTAYPKPWRPYTEPLWPLRGTHSSLYCPRERKDPATYRRKVAYALLFRSCDLSPRTLEETLRNEGSVFPSKAA